MQNRCYSLAFFLSGISALLFQVAWQRLLTVQFGIGCDSITTIVSLYMLGLGMGGLCGGIFARRLKNPLIAYISVESVIGLLGLISPVVLLAQNTHPLAICAFLALPTFMMGLTLPLLIEHLSRTRSPFLDSVSMLYCANTFGAALGAVLGAYVLVSFGGLDTTIYFASAVNFTLAGMILLFRNSLGISEQQMDSVAEEVDTDRKSLGKIAYFAAYLAGFLAIAYEIVWFRTNEILVKASPYAFATTLGLYLSGLGIGSLVLNKVISKQDFDRRKLFLILQTGICFYVLLSYLCLYLGHDNVFDWCIRQSFGTILHPPVNVQNGSILSFFGFFDFVLWPLYFVLVPTILMGASFPIVSDLALGAGVNQSRVVGLTYFCNIMGNVTGGIFCGLFFLDKFGASSTILILSVLSLPFIVFLIFSIKQQTNRIKLTVAFVIVLTMVIWKYPSSSEFITALHVVPDNSCRVYVQEGRDATVVSFTKDNQVWNYINGLPHGGWLNYTHGYYARAIEGLAYARNAKSVLVIGYGTGALVEAVLKCPEVEKVTVVELSSSVMRNLHKIPFFQKLLMEPRLNIIVEDGRKYLQEVDTKYDAIMMDPVRSTTAYSNNIYSQEFFELAKSHLNPGGTLMVWLDNKQELPRTIASVFEHVRLYWACCVVSSDPLVENKKRRDRIMQTFSEADQKEISKAEGYSCDRNFILHYTQGHSTIRDLKPRTEYYLGLLFGKNKSEISQY